MKIKNIFLSTLLTICTLPIAQATIIESKINGRLAIINPTSGKISQILHDNGDPVKSSQVIVRSGNLIESKINGRLGIVNSATGKVSQVLDENGEELKSSLINVKP